MNREKKLESALVIAAGFVGLFFIFKVKWLLLVAFLVALLCSLSNAVLNGVTWLWFKIAEVLGWINSRILLSVIFYVFLFPLALLMKLFGKSPLKLKREKTSYYSDRNHTYDPADLENTW